MVATPQGRLPTTVMGRGVLIHPRQVVDVQAPASGRLAALTVQVGDVVRQGDVLGTDWGVTAGRNGLLKVEGKTTEKVAASGTAEQEDQLRVEATPLRGVKAITSPGSSWPVSAISSNGTGIAPSSLATMNRPWTVRR